MDRLALLARLKKKTKRPKFWEGVAAILASIGITINPDSMMEIVTGLFLIWGGIEIWDDDGKEEKDSEEAKVDE